jgi:hypothetical protein
MAKQFSPALLGHEIEGIWHTGIVVYGKEFYYGGGIQSALPGNTVAGKPMRVHDLGVTYIPEQVFLDFLREISHRFTPETYSLLKHNCNNFSNEASLFLTGNPIPDYITGLPEFALSTPMGMMLKPLLEQFENQMKGGGGAPGFVPWQQPQAANRSQLSNQSGMQAATPIAPSQGTVSAISGEGEVLSVINRDLVENIDEKEPDLVPIVSSDRSLKEISTNSKPFLSLDLQKPPSVYLDTLRSKSIPSGVCDQKTFDAIKQILDFYNSASSGPVPAASLKIVESAIKNWPLDHLFPVLSLLRVFCAKTNFVHYFASEGKETIQTILYRCFSGVSQSSESAKNCPSTVKLIAMCLIANLLGHNSHSRAFAVNNDIIDAALSCLEDRQKFMKVVGANVAFNCSIILKKASDSDLVTSLLSRVAHCVSEELDSEVFSRLLLAMGHLILYHFEAAIVLKTMDLQITPPQGPSHQKCKSILSDIQVILSSLPDE